MASKEEIIAKTNAAREARKLLRDREAAAIEIQKIVKGWLTRLRISNDTRQNLDKVLANPNSATSIDIFRICRHYLLFCPTTISQNNLTSAASSKRQQELDRTEKLARMLVQSLDHDNPKKSYVGVALNRDYSLAWITHMKSLLGIYALL